MRFGIISDLHLGGEGQGRWHNRLLYDHAEEIARAAVAVVNREPLDAVYVLGDLTQAGEQLQLELARSVLSDLAASWFVLPGNHDRAAVRSGLFDSVFREHLPPELALRDGIAIAAVREHSAEPGGGPDRYRLGESRIAALLEGLRRSRPEGFLLLSHQPLVDEAEWAAAHSGKDAGHFGDGRSLLLRAARLAGRTAVFCGHQHWHHATGEPGWLHCATASLIEYPMEARVVTWEGGRISSGLLPAAPALAEASLESSAWVRGQEADREWTRER